MQTFSITILGGDLRQCYLADYMHTMGHHVTCYGTMSFSFKQTVSKNQANAVIAQADCLEIAVSRAQLILCPIPFSKDKRHLFSLALGIAPIDLGKFMGLLKPGQFLFGGNIPKEILATCREKQVSAIDLLKDPSLQLANAALTAEGLLSSIIAETPFSLRGRNLLLLGFGRCGQEIGKLLTCFNMKISAYDKDASCLLQARMQDITPLGPEELQFSLAAYDLIINTIPSQILTPQQLSQLSDTCLLFDIASAPGGFENTIIQDLKLKLVCCPGIPGKVMPRTAGELIGKTILERML